MFRKRLSDDRHQIVIYKGYKVANKKVLGTNVYMSEVLKDNATEEEKETARSNFCRRSSVETIIGHLKNDFRLNMSFLKRASRDKIYAILSAVAFNFKKWCNNINTIKAAA